jgi:predicted PurR-regulated permease PerM
MKTPATWSPREVVLATLTAVLVVAAMALAREVFGALIAFFVAVLLSSAVQPLVALLERRARGRLSRSRAALLVHAAIVVVAVGFALLLLPVLIEQVSSLWSSVPDLYASLRSKMIASDSESLHRIAGVLPEKVDPSAGGASLDSLSFALAGLGRLGSALLTAAGILVLSYAWSVNGERTVRSLLLLLPLDRRAEAAELADAATTKLAAFVRGQLILCGAVGGLAFIAYTIIQLPHAVALAVMAGLFEAIPLIGPTLGAVPAALVGFTVDPVLVLWVGLATLVIQMAENYILVPRVMEGSVGVHPFVTILSIAAFGAVMGIPGALLAIPLAALIQLLLEHFVLEVGTAGPAAAEGRTRVSLLRYEAQHLAADIRQIVRTKDEQANSIADALEEELEAITVDLDRVLADREDTPVATSTSVAS